MSQCSTINMLSDFISKKHCSLSLWNASLLSKSEFLYWSIGCHAEPKLWFYTPLIYVDITGHIWDISEGLDSANYPPVSLFHRYTNAAALFPERSVVCSWFKGGKLLQPVASLATKFMNLKSLNSYRILETTDGKGLWSIIQRHVPRQDYIVQLTLCCFVQTCFEKLLGGAQSMLGTVVFHVT